MQAYMTTGECRMAFLARLLDDPDAHECGHCANDGGRVWPREVDEALVIAAIEMIRGDAPVIEPRKQTADGRRLSHVNEAGRALCHLGDAGWGRRVVRGREAGRFDDELVEASAALIADRWGPLPAPGWVAAVPSASRPSLVGEFAARLADALGLPFVDALTTRDGAAPQREMLNSAQQADNARRKLGVRGDLVRRGPVLLVDDVVDSRWTLTVAGELLRSNGAGAVHPFVLAVAAGRGS